MESVAAWRKAGERLAVPTVPQVPRVAKADLIRTRFTHLRAHTTFYVAHLSSLCTEVSWPHSRQEPEPVFGPCWLF